MGAHPPAAIRSARPVGQRRASMPSESPASAQQAQPPCSARPATQAPRSSRPGGAQHAPIEHECPPARTHPCAHAPRVAPRILAVVRPQHGGVGRPLLATDAAGEEEHLGWGRSMGVTREAGDAPTRLRGLQGWW